MKPKLILITFSGLARALHHPGQPVVPRPPTRPHLPLGTDHIDHIFNHVNHNLNGERSDERQSEGVSPAGVRDVSDESQEPVAVRGALPRLVSHPG